MSPPPTKSQYVSETGYPPENDGQQPYILHGVHILPSELILMIFDRGLMADRLRGARRRIRIPFPVLVSHVCMHWRALALGSPWLWTDIHLTLYHGTKFWRLYLQRSYPAALSVDLVCGPARGKHDGAMLELALHLILPHIMRWKRLTVFSDRDQVIRTLADSLKDQSAPALETLEFLHSDVSWWGEATPIQFFCGDTPSLSTIRLRNITWDWRKTSPINLTTLDIAIPRSYAFMAFSWTDFEEIVHNSPRLVHLALSGAPIALPSQEVVTAPVVIETLRSLMIKLADTGTYSTRLCALMSMPRLEELTIEGGMQGFMRALPSWQPWSVSNVKPDEWEVKYPRMRKLTLIETDPWEPDLISLHFAQALPGTEELRLIGVDVAPIFRFLSQAFNFDFPSSAAATVPWRGLKIINIEKWPKYEHVSPLMLAAGSIEATSAEVEGIKRLVEHRKRTGKPLHALVVRPVEAFRKGAIAMWLREQGLDPL
ncbi:hypothetical protein PUNSTDRAFT_126880 [Punctularia strigosozonata HHB-11173 SS5]|uniref:uncharacterized protein n=1 Tax=Punctularia strigosozonata (strain HHB-11173) TaxID=741275 RepID=UPI0004416B95|nr:uncharacterized protein PUNSTDRAFT_126880 [Punctularia strigosozonata HHB-11173 SS5]EIN06962.1 hypothetical protein PUNSTDRAFT_126880 [Punctularia strigosozonata HHB-11173 SS5]